MINPNDFFTPTRALRGKDADYFAGREKELRSLFEAVTVEGSAVVVYGDRGIGKTTLARFAQAALGGDERAAELGRMTLSYLAPERFVSFWVECDQRCENFNDVLRKLLRRPGEMTAARSKVQALPAPKLDYDANDWELETAFRDWIEAVRHQYSVEEVVIFIDEFDRLPDKRHVGEIAKNADGFKFVIVGVGEVIEDLVADHQSVARIIQTVRLPALSSSEVAALFTRAGDRSAQQNGSPRLSFSSSFVDRAFADSGGFPYLIQLIGYQAVRALGDITNSNKEIKLNIKHYDRGIDLMFSSRLAELSDHVTVEIRNALAHSKRAFGILKEIADADVEGVHSVDLLRRLNSDLRVGYYDTLDQLVESGVLHRNAADEKQIGFGSPMTRLLVRLLMRQGLEHYEKVARNG